MRNQKTLFRVLMALLCVLCLTGNTLAEAIKLPAELKTINEEAFAGSGITSVEIPEGTEFIDNGAFAENSALTDVYLPKSDVMIAANAFDQNANLIFHAYMGTANANWAIDQGYTVEYYAGGGEAPSTDARRQVSALIVSEGSSSLQDNKYGTGRLIVKLNSGTELPMLDEYQPKAIIPMGNDLYVLQFNNYLDAKNCAMTLDAWSGSRYVEADYFLSGGDSEVSPNSMSSIGVFESNGAFSTTDPMGFTAYTNYLPDTIGNVTIAIIDNGITANQVDCTVSSKSYDFITNKYTLNGSEHGTTVAGYLCNSFGKHKNHLTLISYNVEEHATGKISYLMMGLAIQQAKEDGAEYINISIAGESSYAEDQDNVFLQECIQDFGRDRIIAAGGNYASSVNNFIPAKYCTNVTGVKLSSDNMTLVRAGTATGAQYGGFSTYTSYAAPMITAALALVSLDPDHSHKIANTLEPVTGDNAKMPVLSKLVVKPVTEIIVNDGDPVESIMEVGDRASIDYRIIPSDATDTQVNVTVEPADKSVIQIVRNESSRVRISAVGRGSATLIFTSNDGNAPAVVVPITVIQPVISVKIKGNTEEVLMKDETRFLSVNIQPNDATNSNVLWTSSNNSIATVSQQGVVTPVGDGRVTITATSESNPEVSDSVIIEASSTSRPNKVIVSPVGGIYTLYIGKTAGKIQMNASVLPEGTDQTVTWSVDDENIATISSDGLLTAVGDGEVIVTATSVSSGKKGYVIISVEQLPTSITVSGPDTVIKDQTVTFTAVVSPLNTRNKSFEWSSSDTAVATVSSTGAVTGKKAGTAFISATSLADGTVTGQKSITVIVLPDSVTINQPSSTTLDIGENLALSATVLPSNTYDKTLTWSTSDSTIATVSNGVVTAKAAGSVRITAMTVNGKTSMVDLTVRQPYTLVFNANGGSCSTASATAYSGYAIGNILPTPTRTYYTFVGWYTAEIGGTKLSSSWYTTCATTYIAYAHWTHDICYITFNANGGSCSTNSKSMYCGDAIGTLPTATLDYHNLDGWYTAASGGTKITTATVFTSGTTLYAHWTAKPYSDWVLSSSVPSNGTVRDRKWSYTETTSSTSSNLSGWSRTGSKWVQSGSGSVDWVNFSVIPGFKTSHSLYTKYHNTAPTASETETAKKEVSTSRVSYLYWHWMYSSSGTAYDRAIFYKQGTGTQALTGNNYAYKNFGAFESTKDYTTKASGNWGQDDTYYQWYKVGDRTSNADTQGSFWWYKTPINRTTYTDYTKYYTYSRNMESSTQPYGDNILNVQEWVRYQLK